MNPTTRIEDAAVLAPVYRDAAGAARIVLIRRSERGLHGGQIALPGGRREPGDASYLDTALREAAEEIGLESHAIRVLAPLPVITTLSSRFRIHPYLARVRPGPWRPQVEEVSEVLDVPVADLTRADLRGERLESLPGREAPVRIEYLRLGPHRLWGATWRIVRPLAPRLLAGEWSLD
jgi:8-oxo-dGTP pyrophosphatase MutT (NUDIX family)